MCERQPLPLDQDDEVIKITNKGRKQGANGQIYVFNCTFPSFNDAKEKLKGKYFGTIWEQGNIYKKTVRFNCKTCEMRLKVVQDEITDECHIHLDSKHFDENGDHEDEIEDKKTAKKSM
jgi:hypothetical protein